VGDQGFLLLTGSRGLDNDAQVCEPPERAAGLPKFRTERHVSVRSTQDDLAAVIVKSGDQALGSNRTDLLRGKINDANNQFSDELIGIVETGDLRARFLYADLDTKVDKQDVGRLARLRKGLGTDDAASAQFDLFKVLPRDFVHVGFQHRGLKSNCPINS
jgi:hypothetical protein